MSQEQSSRKKYPKRIAIELQKDEIIRLHRDAGMGCEAIGERLGCGRELVKQLLVEWGAYKRVAWTPEKAKLEEQKEQICQLYSQGIGAKRIASALGHHNGFNQTINAALKRWGVYRPCRFAGGYKRGLKVSKDLTVVNRGVLESAELLIVAGYKRDQKAVGMPDRAWGYEWVKEKARRQAVAKYWSSPEHFRAYSRGRHAEMKADPSYRNRRRKNRKDWQSNPRNRMRTNLGTRLWIALTDKSAKRHSVTELIGCSLPQLRAHLEGQFSKRMDWENYGSAWHVDHITPCSYFNLLDVDEQRRCFHYTNLRPLWASANVRRGDRAGHVQQSLLLPATHPG